MSNPRKRRRVAWTVLPAVCLALLIAAGVGNSGEPEDPSPFGFLSDAVMEILTEAAGAVAPTSEGTAGAEAFESAEAVAPEAYATPPEGLTHHEGGQQGQNVSGPAVHRLRGASKEVPEASGSFASNSPAVAEAAGDWKQLGFATGAFRPEPGLDPALAATAASVDGEGREHVYGFVLLREYLTDAARSGLEAAGVKLLGPHGDAYKARFPADADTLAQVGALGDVEWLGLSLPGQKLDASLKAAADAASEAPSDLPVVVNLFENVSGFKEKLEWAGAVVGHYDPELTAYRAVVSRSTLDTIIGLDFVLYVELVGETRAGHDQSMASMGTDYIRPGAPGTTFNGSGIPIGIMDTGFMLGGAAATPHVDLNAWGCGQNFTSDAAGVWDDENSHGTHVLGTIMGRGVGNSRYRGVGLGIANSSTTRVRAAKVWGSSGSGSLSWMESAMDYLDDASACSSPRPLAINISGGGTGTNLVGTDSLSRKLDGKVYSFNQLYVSCGGNTGPGAGTIWTPGVAKNALAVGNALDNGYLTVGDANNSSSRGPAGDGRRKPNVMGPGTVVTSVQAGTANGYSNKTGCSMATPHVTGLATTLMQHYTSLQSRPAVMRSLLMASAIPHNNNTVPSNTYGFGRVSSYVSHWALNNANGWTTHWGWGDTTGTGNWTYWDLTVPSGTDRLVVALTWDEPAASAGAARAVNNDVDLWLDRLNDCGGGNCGEYASASTVDNVEYVVVNNPTSGLYRIKAYNYGVSQTVHLGFSAVIIRGDPTPTPSLTAVASTLNPVLNSNFTITTTLSNPSYVASGVHLQNTVLPAGSTRVGVRTTREDGILHDFGTATNFTLGNIRAGDTRSATWTFRLTTHGTKTFTFRTWSENAGTQTRSVTVTSAKPDLQVTALSAPSSAEPSQTIGVSNTVRNLGTTSSPSSLLRLYLSTDTTCTTGDTYLAQRTVPALGVNGTSTATTSVTIPAATSVGFRYICGIADYNNAVSESNESNNTRYWRISITGRPDFLVTALSGPTIAEPGNVINVSNTVRNLGTVSSPTSLLRLYLSNDANCTTGDTYLGGQRTVPALGVNGTSTAATAATIPAATAAGFKYVCAIADYNNAVTEWNEGNNTRSYRIEIRLPPPEVNLKINGDDPAYPLYTTTPGRIKLTIDMTSGTTPVDHYYAIIFGGIVYWVDPGGNLVLTVTPIATFTPAPLSDYVLLDADFSAFPGFWGFAWIMVDAGATVDSDVVMANVTGGP